MQNAISWFEIPTTDIDRATKFYEAVFNVKLNAMDMPNIKMRSFPLDNPMSGIGGALVHTDGFHQPSETAGVLIYLNANPDIQPFLDRIEKAGGKIFLPKTEISPDYGFMAIFIDCEGNRIGLHSVPLSML
jgi:predicted enzyme related to lactoylglutathione lyase